MGDDLVDLSALQAAGLSVAPADAHALGARARALAHRRQRRRRRRTRIVRPDPRGAGQGRGGPERCIALADAIGAARVSGRRPMSWRGILTIVLLVGALLSGWAVLRHHPRQSSQGVGRRTLGLRAARFRTDLAGRQAARSRSPCVRRCCRKRPARRRWTSRGRYSCCPTPKVATGTCSRGPVG